MRLGNAAERSTVPTIPTTIYNAVRLFQRPVCIPCCAPRAPSWRRTCTRAHPDEMTDSEFRTRGQNAMFPRYPVHRFVCVVPRSMNRRHQKTPGYFNCSGRDIVVARGRQRQRSVIPPYVKREEVISAPYHPTRSLVPRHGSSGAYVFFARFLP